MSDPVFGMTFSRPDDEPVPALGADFSKGLFVEASTDADATAFPIGQPVRISTADAGMLAKLGTGPLRDAVNAVNSQLNGLNAGADVTIYRVAEGANGAATAANIATALAPTNIASIPSAVNATPRLVWAGRGAYRVDMDTAGPVAAALHAACERLLAVSVIDVDDTSAANAIDARETLNSERIMPIGVAARVYSGSNLVTKPMGPRIIGLFQRVDSENGGKPFEPIANRAVYGIAGLSRQIPFSLLDGSTEGQQMLESEVSIVAAGESGVDGSIADGGFVFIGTDNTTTGELWKQIHQVRGADYLTVKMMEITRQFLGPKISAARVEAWINSLKFMLRDHKGNDDILGYEVKFDANKNSPEEIRLGHLLVNLGIEPAPSFKLARHEVRRYRPAVEGLVADIIARLSTVN
ncbi:MULTISPECIES: phage tail sheath protein [unclassified Rhizobium]|uniref:phage tail protein n=1 Tax=unclassified Rhizobium TaxID=2613769 RepID=UPI001AD9F84E|nr:MULTISPECIES: phage tail protein [unclassified Rhizobium]MBO9125451.1 phage tail protein [Rhizobium sp. 16-488-2b]MBO9176036.1 phage tail protein [Rhizobium sp. 16-488-2a]